MAVGDSVYFNYCFDNEQSGPDSVPEVDDILWAADGEGAPIHPTFQIISVYAYTGDDLHHYDVVTTQLTEKGLAGAWANITYYVEDDYVTYGGNLYICLSAHTSDENGGDGTGGYPDINPTEWNIVENNGLPLDAEVILTDPYEVCLLLFENSYAVSNAAKAINPTPANAVNDVTLDQATLTWEDGGGATSYDVYYGTTFGNLTKVSSSQAGLSFTISGITNGSPFNYLITRYWRIDSKNAYGTTTGDEWSFTTIRLSAPVQTYWSSEGGYYYRLLIDADGDYGDHPIDGGVENTDYKVLAGYLPNFINTTRKLVGVANSKIWVEDI